MMRMLWIVYAGQDPDGIASRLDALGAQGWTRLDHAHGSGTHGRVEGSRAWPGEETVFIIVAPVARANAIADGIAAAQSTLAAGERLHVAVLPVERFQ